MAPLVELRGVALLDTSSRCGRAFYSLTEVGVFKGAWPVRFGRPFLFEMPQSSLFVTRLAELAGPLGGVTGGIDEAVRLLRVVLRRA